MRSGGSIAVLHEDDGISIEGPLTKVTISLEWNETEVLIDAAVSGDYALPYREMRVILPTGEARVVEMTAQAPPGLAGNRIQLVR